MRKKNTRPPEEQVPEEKRVYRQWIEIRDVVSGATLELPLSGRKRIHLPTKQHKEKLPDVHVLVLTDGSETLEALSLDELANQLRARYPDQSFERTLHRERDLEAERRRSDALDRLGRVFVDAVVNDMLRKEGD